MDPNTSVPNQATPQAGNRAQAPEVVVPQPTPSANPVAIPTPPSVSAGKELQPSVASAEAIGEMTQPEQSVQAVGTPEQPRAEVQETSEIVPIAEHAEQQAEVEKFVEVLPNSEKPDIPKEVLQAGVTHSGPGLIIEENTYGVKALPVTYHQAASAEKVTEIQDSKHWLMAQIMYVWRKINPLYGREKRQKNDGLPKRLPIKAFSRRNQDEGQT